MKRAKKYCYRCHKKVGRTYACGDDENGRYYICSECIEQLYKETIINQAKMYQNG